MDTKTCEICKATGPDVQPIGDTIPELVCDLCCELLAAHLAILSVLK